MTDLEKLSINLDKAKLEIYKYYTLKYKDLIEVERKGLSKDVYFDAFTKEQYISKRLYITKGNKYELFDIIHDGSIVFVHTYLNGPIHINLKRISK